MKLLLDTHAFLWFIVGSPKLSKNARLLIEDLSNEKFVSVASLWEIAIKVSLGKMILTDTYENAVLNQIGANGFKNLSVKDVHLSTLIKLPFYHRDPFDRLLISQAIVENFDIVSIDTAFDSYNIQRFW